MENYFLLKLIFITNEKHFQQCTTLLLSFFRCVMCFHRLQRFGGHDHLCYSSAHCHFSLGRGWRETKPIWILGPLTFFSVGSLQPESLSLWRSWNLTLTSSMLSCSRSQKPARSWEVGWGYAAGSWAGRDVTHWEWVLKIFKKRKMLRSTNVCVFASKPIFLSGG